MEKARKPKKHRPTAEELNKIPHDFEQYYPNGRLWYHGTIIGGRMNGLYEEYFNNGNIVIRGNYKDGYRHGVFEFGNYYNREVRKKIYDADVERGKWELTIADYERRQTKQNTLNERREYNARRTEMRDKESNQ